MQISTETHISKVQPHIVIDAKHRMAKDVLVTYCSNYRTVSARTIFRFEDEESLLQAESALLRCELPYFKVQDDEKIRTITLGGSDSPVVIESLNGVIFYSDNAAECRRQARAQATFDSLLQR